MTMQERITAYRELCEQGKITHLFMQPWWLDATGPWQVALAIRNERIVGAMPYIYGRRWMIKTIGLPALTHHSSIWMDHPSDITPHKWLTREKQTIWSLIDDLPSYGFFSMVFDNNSFDNWLPFHWKGFLQEMRYTFTIDRQEEQEIDERINSSYRKKLRKASELLQIRRDIDPKTFYGVCSKTYARQKIKSPYSYDTFLSLDRAITAHDAGIKFGAYTTDGKLVAVSSVVWDKDKAYYYLSGDEDEGRELGASLYLCREAIRIAFEERAVNTFDFCGSMIEPITEIRRQFGAKSVGLMKIVKSNYRVLNVLYSLTR
ncbi:MAG: GNAT family N-acetyltransferase [Bacteroidota bacterium]|nr:GNAT family N-acetyltransferase [Bacteroidota bacterium]